MRGRAAAGNAADEGLEARRPARPPGVGAPEDERAVGRDPRVDRATEQARELDRDRRLAGPGIDSSDDALTGQTSCQLAVAEAPLEAGIATQGPATGMQTSSPLHSSAAGLPGTLTASAAARATAATAARITGSS